jgi:hypothetical protein
MNKFGLMSADDADDTHAGSEQSLADRISSFPTVRPRLSPDLEAIDAAAAQHGFVSREAVQPLEAQTTGRRRRAVPTEPTRHLAIRLPSSGYDRFVAYADKKRLTYHDALLSLLDDLGQ